MLCFIRIGRGCPNLISQSLSLTTGFAVAVALLAAGFVTEAPCGAAGRGMMWYWISACKDHFSIPSSTGFFNPFPCTCALVSSATCNLRALSARSNSSWATYLYPRGGSCCNFSKSRLAHFSITTRCYPCQFVCKGTRLHGSA